MPFLELPTTQLCFPLSIKKGNFQKLNCSTIASENKRNDAYMKPEHSATPQPNTFLTMLEIEY
jgi:hypothetical protein